MSELCPILCVLHHAVLSCLFILLYVLHTPKGWAPTIFLPAKEARHACWASYCWTLSCNSKFMAIKGNGMRDSFSFYTDQCAVTLINLINLLCFLTLAARREQDCGPSIYGNKRDRGKEPSIIFKGF